MNENNEILNERESTPIEAVGEREASLSLAVTEKGDAPDLEKAEVSGEREPPADAPDAASLCRHPMFACFAKGRREGFDELICAFAEMLRAGGMEAASPNVAAMMTPDVSYAVQDVALTERQRAIARAAGMSYREYYTLLQTK